MALRRMLNVSVAQMGPVARSESRHKVVDRMIKLMEEAHQQGSSFVVFPELALTTFFPRWDYDDNNELESWFEFHMPNAYTNRLFECAVQLGCGFYLGYAELEKDSSGRKQFFNTSILVDAKGCIIGKYRKIHLPGTDEPVIGASHQHLEKKYFDVGNLGFPAFNFQGGVFGMCICNDRRWPEVWRVLGLQGVEVVALGYNTPMENRYGLSKLTDLSMFHNHLCMQAGAYQNGTWVLASAKAGVEEGIHHIGGSCIISPTGEIVAICKSEDDEVITAECDLSAGDKIRETIFNFENHRQIKYYGSITSQTGVLKPDN